MWASRSMVALEAFFELGEHALELGLDVPAEVTPSQRLHNVVDFAQGLFDRTDDPVQPLGHPSHEARLAGFVDALRESLAAAASTRVATSFSAESFPYVRPLSGRAQTLATLAKNRRSHHVEVAPADIYAVGNPTRERAQIDGSA